MALGKLVLRATVGGLMMGHGLQKLNGSFGGPGLEGTEKMMGSIGMHPAKHHARAVALSETIGGALTAAGLFNPLGPAMITGVMAVAIKKVHLKNGPWVTNRGYEYNLTLMAAAFAIASEGPGPLSLDSLLRKHRSGIGWGLFSTALGLGGAAATLKLAEMCAPPEATSAASDDAHGAAAEGETSSPDGETSSATA